MPKAKKAKIAQPLGAKSVGKMPKIQEAKQVTLTLASRKNLRPFQLQRNAGVATVKDVMESKAFDKKHTKTRVVMPREMGLLDGGWRAGPKTKPPGPLFCGKPRGISEKFADLSGTSSAFDYLETQITNEDKLVIMGFTANHMRYRTTKKLLQGKKLGGIGRSLRPDDLEAQPAYFDMWLACRYRLGMCAIGVPQKGFWKKDSVHYCHLVYAVHVPQPVLMFEPKGW
jgi:hypothetical protein